MRGVCSQCGELAAEFEHVAVGDAPEQVETLQHRAYGLFGDLYLYCPRSRAWLHKPGMKIRQGGST